jgi:hypothetical protein
MQHSPSWQLGGLQRVKKFPALHGTRTFVTAFTCTYRLLHKTACYYSLQLGYTSLPKHFVHSFIHSFINTPMHSYVRTYRFSIRMSKRIWIWDWSCLYENSYPWTLQLFTTFQFRNHRNLMFEDILWLFHNWDNFEKGF